MSDNFIIKVDREVEKRLYRVLKELEMHGESKIENAHTPEWQGTMRTIGIRAKPLIEGNLIEPIWKTENKNHFEDRLIRKTKDAEIKEVKGNSMSFFHFKRRQIV